MSPGRRILIAEDEPLIAAFLGKGLRAEGYETEVAASARAAVRLASSGRFDLVLLDIAPQAAPGDALRAAAPELPVVVLTASRDEAAIALRAGARDYVTKPFTFDQLLHCVHAALAGAGGGGPTSLRRRLHAAGR